MATVSGFVLFFLIWWTVLFATLPFGNRRPEHLTPGQVGSAPSKHHMPRKILATTFIAVVLWYPLHTGFVRYLDYVREEARLMAERDASAKVEDK